MPEGKHLSALVKTERVNRSRSGFIAVKAPQAPPAEIIATTVSRIHADSNKTAFIASAYPRTFSVFYCKQHFSETTSASASTARNPFQHKRRRDSSSRVFPSLFIFFFVTLSQPQPLVADHSGQNQFFSKYL